MKILSSTKPGLWKELLGPINEVAEECFPDIKVGGNNLCPFFSNKELFVLPEITFSFAEQFPLEVFDHVILGWLGFPYVLRISFAPRFFARFLDCMLDVEGWKDAGRALLID